MQNAHESYDIIRKKPDGFELSRDELAQVIAGHTAGWMGKSGEGIHAPGPEKKITYPIDHFAGIILNRKVGDQVSPLNPSQCSITMMNHGYVRQGDISVRDRNGT
jgi:thymidine phosphorylase